MKNIFFLIIIFSLNIYAQKIENNDFSMNHWLLMGKEKGIISKDTLILFKTKNSEKLFKLKEFLIKSDPEIKEILFLNNRLYFNPYNINCGCNSSKESYSWKWKFDTEKQIININAQGRKKNRFRIMSVDNILINEIETKKLILIRI
jgi:hypothetical protein